MRKILLIAVMIVFVGSFLVGVLTPPAQASIACTAACINGQLRVCCYNAQHVYTCNNVGPCNGDL